MKKIKSLLRKITRKKYVTFSSEETNGPLSDATTTKEPQPTCYPDMMYISCHDEGRQVEEKGPIAYWWETEEGIRGADDPTANRPPYMWSGQTAWTGERIPESGYENDQAEDRFVSTIEGDESSQQVHTLSKKNLQSPIIQVDRIALTEDREPRNDPVGYLDGERQANHDDDGSQVSLSQSEGRTTIPAWAEDEEQNPGHVTVSRGNGHTLASDSIGHSDSDHVPSSYTTHNNLIHRGELVQSDQENLQIFPQATAICTEKNDDEPPYLLMMEDSDVAPEPLNVSLSSSGRDSRDPKGTIEIPGIVVSQDETSVIQTSYSSSTENENCVVTPLKEENMTEEESLQCLLYSYYCEMQSRFDMEKIELFMLDAGMGPVQRAKEVSQKNDQRRRISGDSRHGNRECLQDSYSPRVAQHLETRNRKPSLYKLIDKNRFERRDAPSLVNESLLHSKFSLKDDRPIPLGGAQETNLLESGRANKVCAGDDHQSSFAEVPFQVDLKNKLPVGYLIALFESIARRRNVDPASNWNAMANGIKLLKWHSSHTHNSHENTSNAERKSPTPNAPSQSNEFSEDNQREEISTRDRQQLRVYDHVARFSSVGELYSIEEGDESNQDEDERPNPLPVMTNESSHPSSPSLQGNEDVTEHGCDRNNENSNHSPTEDKCKAFYDIHAMDTSKRDSNSSTYDHIIESNANSTSISAHRDGSVKGHVEDWTTRPKKTQYDFVEDRSETSRLVPTRNTDAYEPIDAGGALKGQEPVKSSLRAKFQGSAVHQSLPDLIGGDHNNVSSKLKSVATLPTSDASTADQPPVSNTSSHSRRSHDGDSWWIGNSRSKDTVVPQPRIETHCQDEAVESTKEYVNMRVRRNLLKKYRPRDLNKKEDIPHEIMVKASTRGGSQDKSSKKTKKASQEATVTPQAKSITVQRQGQYHQYSDTKETPFQDALVDLRAQSFPPMKQQSQCYYEVGTTSQVASMTPRAHSDHRRHSVHEVRKAPLKDSVNQRAHNVPLRKQRHPQFDEQSHDDRVSSSSKGLSSELQPRQPSAEKISHEARVDPRGRNAPSLKQRCQHFYEVEESSSVNTRSQNVPSRKQRHQHDSDKLSREGRVKERERFVSSHKLRRQHFYEVGNTSQEDSVDSLVRESPLLMKRHKPLNESKKRPKDVSKVLPIVVDDNSLRSISERTRTLLSASDDALVGPTLSSSPSDEGEGSSHDDPFQGSAIQVPSQTMARRIECESFYSNEGEQGSRRMNVETKSTKYQTLGRQNNDGSSGHKNRIMHNTTESRPEAPKFSDLGGRAFSHISALAGFVASGLRPDAAKSQSAEFRDPEVYDEQQDMAAFAHGDQARDDRSSVKGSDKKNSLETDVQSFSPSDEYSDSDKPSDEEDVQLRLPRRRHEAPKNASKDRVYSSAKFCDELIYYHSPDESFYPLDKMGETAAQSLSPTDDDSHKEDFMPSDEEAPQTNVSMDRKSIGKKDKRSSEHSRHQRSSCAHAANIPQEVEIGHYDDRKARISHFTKSPRSSSTSHRKPSHKVAKQSSSTHTRRSEANDRPSRSTRHGVNDSFEQSFVKNLSPIARMRHQRQIFDSQDETVPAMQCFSF